MAKENKQIVINASTVKISGGLYIALDLITAFLDYPNIDIKIICPEIRPFKKFREKAEMVYVPKVFFHYLFRPLLDYWWLNKNINKFHADLVISLSNLPARTRKKQAFFHDNAFMSADNLTGLNLGIKSLIIHSLRRYAFQKRIPFIDRLIVQTALEKTKLINRYGQQLPITILPPILPSHLTNKVRENQFKEFKKNSILVGCLSRYFEHKNLEILIDVAKLCKEQQLPYRFIITIDQTQGKKAKRLLRKIKDSVTHDRIINAGKVPRRNISDFVQSVDALILPSLIETFGLNCIEAWFHNKPLFISDKEFSREVCNCAAVFFNPKEAQSIIKALNTHFNNDTNKMDLNNEGKKRLAKLPQSGTVIAEILRF